MDTKRKDGDVMAVARQYKRNSATLDIEPTDLDETMKIAADCLRKTKGQQAVYENSEEGRQRFVDRAVEYFEHIRIVNAAQIEGQKPMIADIESFCCWMHIVRQTLLNYSKRSPQWAETIDMIRQAITAGKKQLFLSGKMPPVTAIFDLVNNTTDYRNVSEFRLTADTVGTDRVPALSVDELEQIAAQDEPPALPKGE